MDDRCYRSYLIFYSTFLNFHTMTTYIPYSTRNNITDPDLAWLLDYLERVMGWDIEFCDEWPNGYLVYQDNISWYTIEFHYKLASIYRDNPNYIREKDYLLYQMDEKLFFRTYRTLLPAIRDLYSK